MTSSRARTSALFFAAAAALAVAVRAQQPSLLDQAVAALYPDPSPSKRGAGNQLYTTLSNNQTNSSISALIKNNPAASAVKGKVEGKRERRRGKKILFFRSTIFFVSLFDQNPNNSRSQRRLARRDQHDHFSRGPERQIYAG